MNNLRIGIIGSGFMGRTHAKGVTMTPGAQLVAVAGGTRAPTLAEEFAIICEPDLPSLYARDDIDAVVVTTPHQCHAEHTLLALRAGKHVLVEKPMATTVEDCEAMQREAVTRRLCLGLGYHQRFRAVNRLARDIIRRGELGRIVDIQAFLLGSGGSTGHAWMMEAAAGGWLLGYGVHLLDLLRWFLDAEPEWLIATSATMLESVPVENTTQLLLRFPTGTRVACWSSSIVPVLFPGTSCGMWVAGEYGSLMLDSFGKLRVAMRGSAWQTVAEQAPLDFRGDGMLALARMGAYAALMADFVAACTAGREPMAHARDGRAGVAISLAAYQSGMMLQPVAGPY